MSRPANEDRVALSDVERFDREAAQRPFRRRPECEPQEESCGQNRRGRSEPNGGLRRREGQSADGRDTGERRRRPEEGQASRAVGQELEEP